MAKRKKKESGARRKKAEKKAPGKTCKNCGTNLTQKNRAPKKPRVCKNCA